MARNLFSVPIFFIVFRETLEAAIIVSVLLGLVEQIVKDNDHGTIFATHIRASAHAHEESGKEESAPPSLPHLRSTESPSDSSVSDPVLNRRLIRKLRIQIFVGAGLGFLIALAIGAAFIAIWFTKASDLWSKSEELWEGTFELIAALIIFVMGITMLKMDRAKAKWRVKLQRAFADKAQRARGGVDRGTRTGKWVLFVLPLITVLREGIEAIVFVGGVSLGQPAASIPIAAVVGLVCGLVCGFLIYAFASRSTITTFLVVMTNFILLIGAGLFSKAVGAYQSNAFNHLLGMDVDDASAAGDGPGSYDVRGNVWHLDCCNPEDKQDGEGWSIFAAIFGWTHSATLGTVLSYVFYWIAVMVALVYLKYKEGRTTLFGRESAAGGRRRVAREKTAGAAQAAQEEESEK